MAAGAEQGDDSLAIGIVGGSIAGCLMALELHRAGHRVTVYERSADAMEGLLGAGLGTPTPMFEKLLDRELIGPELPHLALEDMAFVGRDPSGARHGRVALTLPLVFIAFHWGDLHRGLRARVPDEIYRAGTGVAEVTPLDGGAAIRLDDGAEHEFDVVIAADGYHSQVRPALFPGTGAEYRGYVCWRGVFHEEEMDRREREEMGATFARFGCDGMSGSFLYPLPGEHGGSAPGERLINWGCYVPVPGDELREFLIDRDGNHHDGTIPPGRMRPQEEARLRAIAADSLPPYYADLIGVTSDTFAQAVFSVRSPGYRIGRVCLAGDAGSVAPPFTGSGIFKAASNAMGLAEALDGAGDVDTALARWDAAQHATAEQILDLGRQFDEAFIDVHPDFGAMDEGTTLGWWRGSVTDPDGFSFEAR